MKSALALAAVLFIAAIVAMSAATNREERVRYGAVPAGLALIAFGVASCLHGREVARRPHFDWYGIRYSGSRVRRFARGFLAGGLAAALLGIGCVALWLMS